MLPSIGPSLPRCPWLVTYQRSGTCVSSQEPSDGVTAYLNPDFIRRRLVQQTYPTRVLQNFGLQIIAEFCTCRELAYRNISWLACSYVKAGESVGYPILGATRE
jgi:hypothetical protein